MSEKVPGTKDNTQKTGQSNTPKNELSQLENKQNNTNKSQNQSKNEISGNVKVVCRFRPLNQKELQNTRETVCVEFKNNQTVKLKVQSIAQHEEEFHSFSFDQVFDMNATQQEIYEFAAKPVIQSVLEGFNGTVFAYGQTSSGKTHTMQGPSIDDPNLRGIIPRMVNTVFETILNSTENIEYTVKISIVEIYNEQIRDLLDASKTNLKVREDRTKGIYIEDVTEKYVGDEEEVYKFMKFGNQNRAVSATHMNEGSSRSHLLFILTIHSNNLSDLSAKMGKLFLVDLAGSEKISKTGAAGQLLEEAKKINQSLSTLGNVINALTDDKATFIPYRNSKLTRVLQESLGGNSRTTLIITCSPSSYNDQETLSTLRFGHRAKSIKNQPKINREFTVAELQLLLTKAEDHIQSLLSRQLQLEDIIKKYGETVPPTNFQYQHLTDNNQTENPNFQTNFTDNHFVQQLDSLNLEYNNIEKENEYLLSRIAEYQLKLQEEEQITRTKDQFIENLTVTNQSMLIELETIKKVQQTYLEQLEQKDNQIEQYQLIQKEFEIKQENQQKSYNMLYEFIIELYNNNKKYRWFRESIEEFCNKHQLNINILLQNTQEQEQQQEEDIEDYELIQDKLYKLQEDFKNVKQLYDQVVCQEIPKYDEIYTKIENDILTHERKKMQEESNKLKKQLQHSNEQIIKLELLQINQSEKYREIQLKHLEAEQFYKRKINSLERNLEQINNLLQQIINLKNQKNHIPESIIQKRQEKLMNLEHQIVETKQLATQYRSRFDYLKKQLLENVEIPYLQQQQSAIHTQDYSDDDDEEEENNNNKLSDLHSLQTDLNRKNSTTHAKIAKPLRGGRKASNEIEFRKNSLKKI